MASTPADIGSLLASIDTLAKHYRLETAVRDGGVRVFHFSLWTTTNRRVSAYGKTPMAAVERALAELHGGRTKPADGRRSPRVLAMASATTPLRLVDS